MAIPLRDADDYDESELGWAMFSLKQRRDRFLEKACVETYASFKEAIETVVSEYDAKPTLSTVREFPVYFMEFWAELQKEKFELYGYYNELDVFIEIVLKTNALSDITDTPGKERILACALLTRIALVEIGVGHPDTGTVNDVLRDWLGKEVPCEHLHTIEAYADLIYSPSALALCSDEVDECTELARHFYGLELPVAKPLGGPNVHLPMDITY